MFKVIISIVFLFCFLWGAAPVKEQVEKVGTIQRPIGEADITGLPEQLTIPRMLNYQGKLTDAVGNPARDSNYSMTFRFFAVPTGGTAFWTETKTILTRAGLFNTLLGDITPIPSIPLDGNCYLEMQVNPNPPMTPRIRIVSSAYSYLSRKADSANYAASAPPTGSAGGDLAGTYPNPTIATNAVTTGKILDTAVTMPKIARAGAATGQVIKWTGTAWAPRPDSATGSPVGPAGGDLTGTYPNPTIATNAVTSPKILDGTIRGVDIAKPCTLTATAPNILSVINTGGAFGSPAIYASAVQGPGLFVKSGLQAGVWVDSTGVNSSAFYARKTTRAGVEIDSTALYGLWLRGYAGSHGILLRKTVADGIRIDTAGGSGVYVVRCDTGMTVYRGKIFGVRVDSAGVSGFSVDSASVNGLWVQYAGLRGVGVADADGYGVYANSDDYRGGYFRNNNNDYYALTAWNNTGVGGTVKGLYVQGHGYATGGWQTLLGDGSVGFGLTSTDMDIVARGSASLTNGQTSINFEKAFQDAFSKDVPLTIIVTPTSECNGIFVANKSSTGFTAKELLNGKSNATFDWIAIGRIKGYEQRPEIRPITGESPKPSEKR